MANRNLFKSQTTGAPAADAVNEAGGMAYAFGPQHALSQYAVTGCLNSTFYADAETQLQEVLKLAAFCSPDFIGKLAVYSRQKGFMKDMPALLLAHLAARDVWTFKSVFPRVVDNVKMLRNFVQIIRSGVVGRKSLGTAPRRAIREFLDGLTDSEVFLESIGSDPSIADVVRMAHPRPATESRRHLYAYLLGKEYSTSLLPQEAYDFEAFKKDPKGAPPPINFQFLSSVKMSPEQWAHLAGSMTWHTLRMNLNTLQRNGVFEQPGMADFVAARLRDPETVRKVRVFPFQLLVAYLHAKDVPVKVRNALQDAMEVATENVPSLPGKTVVAVDVSGSMSSPVTGSRGTATTKVSCREAAALMASAILRRNEDAEVLPFDDNVRKVRLNPRDSVMTNAQKLAINGGGTDCSSVLRHLNNSKARADAVIYLSDNQSWVQNQPNHQSYGWGRDPSTMCAEWKKFKARNPGAKLVCIDMQPYGSTQVPDDRDVLNVGGFNDRVFDIVASFLRGELGGDHFVKAVSQT